MRRRSADELLPDALSAVLVALLALVAVRNAFVYPSVSGYDAEPGIAYARGFVESWSIPAGIKNYYTPPGYFLLAGGLVKLGEALGLAEPAHLGQLLSGLLTVATAVLLAALCAIVFPGRAWLRLAAIGFFVSTPVVLKTAAMFHPQPLVTFLTTLALVLTARMLVRRRYGLLDAVALGLVVGAAQLVRSVGLWALGVAGLALLVAAVLRRGERRAVLRSLVVVAAVGVLVALPWYAYLQTRYSNPIFGRTPAAAGSPARAAVVPGLSAAPAAPYRVAQVPSGVPAAPAPAPRVVPAPRLLPSQTLWFYVDPGLPALFRYPQRQGLAPAFWPILYSETWGDYFGVWAWGSTQVPITPAIVHRLQVQSVVGLLPTFLAASGLAALAVLALLSLRSRTELLLVPLLPLVALAGLLYYAYSYPTTDGDTVKALFLLPAMPALAACFGFSLDAIGQRSRWAALALALPLLAGGFLSLRFGLA